jgi:hypothetical protein
VNGNIFNAAVHQQVHMFQDRLVVQPVVEQKAQSERAHISNILLKVVIHMVQELQEV